ncbi:MULTISPECIES: ABC transporter permease subunit [Dethiosulfovibrio]|uniref:Inner-membrane translocator n=3 Tax=Dethiosulfovibrio TaxID=47054 RepID=D2Z868_9BACT|nr:MULTISPECIES: ABC transporter [Dethiosulfovibrio]EFC91665.1 inner-membrane translocator [Dethiosulfovibrio peptidovorans DSM 11002]MCF4114410.1 ABC transporter permease [Dethiosulfovibrio russensis]MCF4142929.1 ABC transporter permease [Dethiosulfovibrio marinus]MCF4145026.1 ABC transporter permease [Dethiosulfovibrio acidaminovorans]
MNKVNDFIERAGWPRIIIGLFLLFLFVLAPFVGVRLDASISDTLVRFGMNGVMVLAMVPMIQAGCGLNFGLPLGIIAGLLGAVTSIEMGVSGLFGALIAMAVAIPVATVLGGAYGLLLNKVKGSEMMIATYVGFSSVAFMCIMWLVLPYRSSNMVWGYAGKGLRTTISVEGFWHQAISDIASFRIGDFFYIPTGMFLFFALLCFFMWVFMRTRTGTAMTTVGSNPEYARASGVNIDRMRVVSVILSTVLGAIGIIVYEQSFGFIQLYMGPFYMAFPAVSAILIGGASVHKATIMNVIVGTILFQGILTMTPSVINSMIQTDMSEVIRIIVSNGMILYALTRVVKVKS